MTQSLAPSEKVVSGKPASLSFSTGVDSSVKLFLSASPTGGIEFIDTWTYICDGRKSMKRLDLDGQSPLSAEDEDPIPHDTAGPVPESPEILVTKICLPDIPDFDADALGEVGYTLKSLLENDDWRVAAVGEEMQEYDFDESDIALAADAYWDHKGLPRPQVDDIAHVAEQLEVSSNVVDEPVCDDKPKSTEYLIGGDNDCWAKIFMHPIWNPSDSTTRKTQSELKALLYEFAENEIDEDDEEVDDLEKSFQYNFGQMRVYYSIRGDVLHVEDCFDESLGQDWKLALGKEHPGMTSLMLSEFLELKLEMTDEPEIGAIGEPSHIQRVINGLQSPEVRFAFDKKIQPMITDEMERIADLCPYYVPEHNRDIARATGVPFHDSFPPSNRHPIHNAHRRMCIDELAKLVKSDITVVNMSEAGIQRLKSKLDQLGKKFEVRSVNILVEGKDFMRFEHFVEGYFSLDKIDTPHVHFSEMAHYLNPAIFSYLKLRSAKLFAVTYDTIFNLLALEFASSPEPRYEAWEILPARHGEKYGTIVFTLEEDSSNKYEQPYDPTMVLMSRYIDVDIGVEVSSSVVASWGSTRLHAAYYAHLDVPRVISEQHFQYVPLPKLYKFQPESHPMRVQHLLGMIVYAHTLSNLTPEQKWAKYRLYMKDEFIYFPESQQRLLFKIVDKIVSLELIDDSESEVYTSHWGCFDHHTFQKIRCWFKVQFGRQRYLERTRRLVDHQKPLRSYPTVTIQSRKDYGSPLCGLNFIVAPDMYESLFPRIYHWFEASFKKLSSNRKNREKQMIETFSMPITYVNLELFGQTALRKTHERAVDRYLGWRPPLPPRPDPVEEPRAVAFPKRAKVPEVPPTRRDRKEKTYEKPKVDREHLNLQEILHDPGDDYEDYVRDMYRDRGIGRQRAHSCVSDVSRDTRDSIESLEFAIAVPQTMYGHDLVSETALSFNNVCFEDPALRVISDHADLPDGFEDVFDAEECDGQSVCAQHEDELYVEKHCDHCPDMAEFSEWAVREGYIRTKRMYREWAERWHEEHPNDDFFDSSDSDSSSDDDSSSESGDDDEPAEDLARSEARERLLEMVEKRDVLTALKRASTKDYIKPKNHDAIGTETFILQDGTKIKHPDYNTRRKFAEQLRKARPAITEHAHEATGETLWDLLYPSTVSKRYNSNPYNNVLEFPDREYPKQDCLVLALSLAFGQPCGDIFFRMLAAWDGDVVTDEMLPLSLINPVAFGFGAEVRLECPDGVKRYGVKDAKTVVRLNLDDANHVTALTRKMIMVANQPVRRRQPSRAAKAVFNRLVSIPTGEAVPWIPEKKRAGDLVRALRAGEVGKHLIEPANEDFLLKLDALIAGKDLAPRLLKVIPGDPGCRKSSPIKAALRPKEDHQVGAFTAVLATNELAQQYRDGIDAQPAPDGGKATPGSMVQTFETFALVGDNPYSIVVDEDKIMKGGLSLLHYIHPDIALTVFAFDPWQATWHSPTETLLNDPDILSDGQLYMKYAKYYLIGTWRFGPSIANLLRMPCFVPDDDETCGIHFATSIPTNYKQLGKYFPNLSDQELQICWKSRGEYYPSSVQAMWASQLRMSPAKSHSAAIGSTVPFSVVVCDEKVLNGNEPRLLYTALTRSKRVLVVMTFADTIDNRHKAYTNPLLRQLIYYKDEYQIGSPLRAVEEHTFSIRDSTVPFPPSLELVLAGPKTKVTNWDFVSRWWSPTMRCVDPDGKQVGARLSRFEEAYVDRPDFHPFIDETLEPNVIEHENAEVEVRELKVSELLAPTSLEHYKEAVFDEDEENEVRELEYRGVITQQLPDLPRLRKDYVRLMKELVHKELKKGVKTKGEARAKLRDDPRLFTDPNVTRWALLQKRIDEATFSYTVRERVRFATLAENRAELESQKSFGMACWQAFKSYQGWSHKIPFEEELLHKMVVAFQERRGSRPLAVKKASVTRADPEQGLMMTIKNQMKLKERNLTKAKAAQPVFTHTDYQLFEEGPRGMYLLSKIKQHANPNWCFYAMMSPRDLEQWQQGHFTSGENLRQNDLKAQDTSMQGWSVVFFAELMRHFSFPEEFITQFTEFKLFKEIGKKVLAIMTDSGEVWTYLLNTCGAAARECLRYGLSTDVAMQSGGDDTQRNGPKHLSLGYSQFEEIDPGVDKEADSTTGQFVSFTTKHGLMYKDPVLLTRRALVKIANGEWIDAYENYFQLYAFNQSKLSQLLDVWDEDELESHSLLHDLFMKPRSFGLPAVRLDTTYAVELFRDTIAAEKELLLATQRERVEGSEYVAPISNERRKIAGDKNVLSLLAWDG